MAILITLIGLVIKNDLEIAIIVYELINLLLCFTSFPSSASVQANLDNLKIYRFTIAPYLNIIQVIQALADWQVEW